MGELYLKQLQVGPMANFAYLIGSRSTGECLVVDPAWDIDALTKAAEADGMRIVGALVTHFHPDHCGGHLWGHDIQGVADLVAKANVPVHVHMDEVEGLLKITGLARTDVKAHRSGDQLTLGGTEITLIHTPGHTPGSQCFLCADRLITGDTLFLTGCGRVDLPGGDGDQLQSSLGRLAALPRNTIVYPGHHYDPPPSLALGEVIRINPYLGAAARHLGDVAREAPKDT